MPSRDQPELKTQQESLDASLIERDKRGNENALAALLSSGMRFPVCQRRLIIQKGDFHDVDC
jgi:hypothetical protein